MIKQIIIYIVFWAIIYPCNAFSQEKQLIITADMQFDYAQQLFEKKDYDTALVEFKRFIHFFPKEYNLKENAEFKTGVCLFALEQYRKAAKVFNEIIIRDKQNKITEDSVFMQAEAFKKIGNFGYAQLVLLNYLKLVEDTGTKDKIYFNLVKIYLELVKKSEPESLQNAKNYLSQISLAGALKYDTKRYTDLIAKLEKSPKKNPATAGLLSIIPGGGFLYCERYKDALTAFCFNAGLMYAAYEAFENDSPALGAVIGFVEAGFYAGNIYGSVSAAHKYNRAQTLKLFNKDVFVLHTLDPANQAYTISLNYNF